MIDIQVHKTLNGSQGSMELDVNCQIQSGKIHVLYGPSGSGKTTLLKIIAGLVGCKKGLIKVDDKTWLDTQAGFNLSTQKRELGFVFQSYALFPSMTVREQLVFALKANQDQSVVDKWLKIIGLTALADQYPRRLSGGQQQRVALARSLIQQPSILLLDEALSALDYETKRTLQELLLDINRMHKTTIIMVSHDLEEIFSLADQVLQLKDGKIIKQGTPEALFLSPEQGAFEKIAGLVIDIQRGKNLQKVTINNHGINRTVLVDDTKEINIGDSIELIVPIAMAKNTNINKDSDSADSSA